MHSMIRSNGIRRSALLTVAFLCLAAMTARMQAATVYVQRNLASDVPGLADFTDPNLVNPWGIAVSPFWVCNQRTGTSTVYRTSGGVFTMDTTVVTVPAPPGKTTPGTCTGIVANTTQGFEVTAGSPANFIFDTEDGTISGWNFRQPDATRAIIKVDNSALGAVYKGLAIASNGAATFLYAANFNAGTIDVFDSNFAKATLAGSFADSTVPEGFAPFNIQNLGGKLYVAYAKQDAAKHDDVSGAGNGYVAVFDTNGNLLKHLISNIPQLSSPWGLAIAPSTFGDFKGALLVGNFGTGGLINAFDVETGQLLGTILDAAGRPISNTGLWGLQFGNGGSGGDPNVLYFAAGISAGAGKQNHGLFGSISVGTTPGAPPAVSDNGVVNSATFAAGTNPVAPGAIISVFGSNLTDGSSCIHSAGCDPTFDNTKRLRTFMAGAQVSINNDLFHPVPIFAATPTQLNVQLPTDLTGTSATLQVNVGGQISAARTITLDPLSPGIFSINSNGTGAGAITHNDTVGTPISAGSPTQPGETIVIYGTGLGPVTPAVATGMAPTGESRTVTTPTVTIDGLPAQVQFSGLAGCCVGLNQINAVVPANVRAGANVNVVVSIGGKTSNTVTIATKAAAGPAAPPPPTLSSLTVGATSMTGGSNYQGMVVLSDAAPSETAVMLSSSNPSVASVPASVTVPAGSTNATFTIAASASVTTSTAVTITASWGEETKTATVTVTPPPPPPNPYPDY